MSGTITTIGFDEGGGVECTPESSDSAFDCASGGEVRAYDTAEDDNG